MSRQKITPYGSVPADIKPIEGLRIRVTPVTKVTLIELDYFADPGKDEEWFARATQGMTDGAIEREYKRNRSMPSGDAFYFEFNDNGGRPIYVHRCSGIIQTRHVSRSFDLGVRRPACVWYQYDPSIDTVWYLREFMPHDCGTHDFRDTVLYLSGEKPYEELTGDAKYWADEVAAREWNPPPPWFEPGTVFANFSGPEAFRRQAAAMKDPLEATDANVLAAGGILLQQWNGPILGRTEVMRRLLKIRESGLPGALFDPACEELVRAVSGGLTFHEPTEEDPISNKPRKDGHFDNIHDGATYGLAEEVPAVDKVLPLPPNRVEFINRMRVETPVAPRFIPFKENRHGW